MLTFEQWELVVGCMPMTVSVARRKIHTLYVEDAVTEVGLDTLIRCAELWDGRVKFSTYAYSALEKNFMKWNLTRNKQIARNRIPRLMRIYEGILAVDRRDYIQWLMGDLDRYQRMLFVLRFWAGLTVGEIGTRLDIPGRTVLRHLNSAINQCKEKGGSAPTDVAIPHDESC